MKRLNSIKKNANAVLNAGPSASAHLPLEYRLTLIKIAFEDIPRAPARMGAPTKAIAKKAAILAGEFYYILTGERPARRTPWEGGIAYGPFIDFLGQIYEILGIRASARHQAKSAIDFVNEKYPPKLMH